MSEDERSSPAADVSETARRELDGWTALLEAGDIEIEGRMPWSSNATLLVSVTLAGDAGKAIYKPGNGERPLWDFPDGLYRREVAAHELSEALELDLVPTTVLRAEAPFGPGSLQRFVDADFEQHYFTLHRDGRHEEALRLLAGFDLLANNADRKGGHVLIDADEHIWGIDNGLCFHPRPKLRTVMWDFAGEPVPEAILAGCTRLLDEMPDPLVALLSEDELGGLMLRARRLVADPVFPQPDLDDRAYPWPLI